MTRSQLDRLLENTVAEALGLAPLHREVNRPRRARKEASGHMARRAVAAVHHDRAAAHA